MPDGFDDTTTSTVGGIRFALSSSYEATPAYRVHCCGGGVVGGRAVAVVDDHRCGGCESASRHVGVGVAERRSRVRTDSTLNSFAMHATQNTFAVLATYALLSRGGT